MSEMTKSKIQTVVLSHRAEDIYKTIIQPEIRIVYDSQLSTVTENMERKPIVLENNVLNKIFRSIKISGEDRGRKREL